MTSNVIQLRPEVLELVREIAARPDSVLLRVPRGSELRTLREDSALASPTSSALSVAERHLVAVHREEVAYVLRCAAWRAIATGEWGERNVHRNYVHGTTIAVPNARELASDASTQLRVAHREPLEEPEFSLLELLTNPTRPIPCAVETLTAAAHRLVPTANGRIFAGLSFRAQGRIGIARTCFLDAWRTASAPGIAAAALQNLGETEAAVGRIRRARDANEIAYKLCPTLISVLVGTLWYSICLSDRVRANRARQELDTRESNSLGEYQKRFQVDRQRLMGLLSPDARGLLKVVREQKGARRRGLLHALD